MTSAPLNLRNEPITQEVFDRMPALLTAYQVKLITGFDDRELADEVKAKRIKVYKRPIRKGCRKSYNKYIKVSVGKVVGFKV